MNSVSSSSPKKSRKRTGKGSLRKRHLRHRVHCNTRFDEDFCSMFDRLRVSQDFEQFELDKLRLSSGVKIDSTIVPVKVVPQCVKYVSHSVADNLDQFPELDLFDIRSLTQALAGQYVDHSLIIEGDWDNAVVKSDSHCDVRDTLPAKSAIDRQPECAGFADLASVHDPLPSAISVDAISPDVCLDRVPRPQDFDTTSSSEPVAVQEDVPDIPQSGKVNLVIDTTHTSVCIYAPKGVTFSQSSPLESITNPDKIRWKHKAYVTNNLSVASKFVHVRYPLVLLTSTHIFCARSPVITYVDPARLVHCVVQPRTRLRLYEKSWKATRRKPGL